MVFQPTLCVQYDRCKLFNYHLAAQPSNNQKFSSQFNHLLVTVVSLLDKRCSDNLEACKQFCSALYISENSSELLFDDEQMKTINNCKTFKELFSTQLRHHWSWNEYSLLESIIDLSGSAEAEDALTRYQNYMAANMGMKIVTESIDNLPPDCTKLCLILDRTYTKFTTENYKEVKKFIFNTLDVHKYIAYPFIRFLFGSLHLEIYVPKHAAEYMIKMVKTKEKVLKENLFVFIEAGGEVVMNVSQKQVVNIHNMPHKIEQILAAEIEMLHIPVWVVKREAIQVTSKIPYKAGSLIMVQTQPRTGDVITAPVEDNQDGSYTVSFPANQTGEVNWKLSITINGVHVKGSPCSVQVVPQYSALDKPSKIVDNGERMGKLWGIAFGKDGVWVVADYLHHLMCILASEDDKMVMEFSPTSVWTSQFRHSVILACDAVSHLCVADHSRMQKLDGNDYFQFSNEGNRNSEYPSALEAGVFTVGKLNHGISSGLISVTFIITEQNNNRTSIFNTDRDFAQSFGSHISSAAASHFSSFCNISLCCL